jgi:hypothetical protein
MIRNLFFYQLVLVALVWLCVMLHWAWPSDCATTQSTPYVHAGVGRVYRWAAPGGTLPRGARMIIRAPYSLHHVAWIVPGALSFPSADAAGAPSVWFKPLNSR